MISRTSSLNTRQIQDRKYDEMRQPKVCISSLHKLVFNEYYLDNQDDDGNDPKCPMS